MQDVNNRGNLGGGEDIRGYMRIPHFVQFSEIHKLLKKKFYEFKKKCITPNLGKQAKVKRKTTPLLTPTTIQLYV